MKTVRRLLYRDIAASVGFVALAFLALFYFIGLVDNLGDVGQRGHTLAGALMRSALDMPGMLYELLPIAVLIGTIYSLSRMAQASEFTILRTGGLGPGRALGLLALLGAVFAGITFLVGDYVAPSAEREGAALAARTSGGLRVGAAGAWMKDRRSGPQGERSFSVSVGGSDGPGRLTGVRIFEFDADGRLVARTQSARARVADDGLWTLEDVRVTRWPSRPADDPQATSAVQLQQFATLEWPSSLRPEVVAAAVLSLRTMSTLDLWRYSQHLSGQEQSSQRYEILFWKKALYPLACLVMVALALPFAYLHSRAGSVSLKVFGGIMLGIAFVLLNNIVGHMGLLRGWTPWVAAAMPSLVFTALSLAAFAWLVRYR